AAPVQWAVLEGDAESGVAIMKMDPGLDTGPVYEMVPEPIRPDDTSGTLADRLAQLGARLLPGTLERIDQLTPERQPEEGVTYASKLSPEDARIDWSMPATAVNNRIRAFNPRPGAWTTLNGKRLKVWSARVLDPPSGGTPGSVRVEDDRLLVTTGSGVLQLLEVQPEGKARMPAADFLLGHRHEVGPALE
ncbi:MAG TPA: methionyl-tRNA formyltransferase, partial [Actinomycetota bacterium]|nr:methionyl-tRNA formyltransferase [Actinomycetota bacterium]